MAYDDLTDVDIKVHEYLKTNDFVDNPWSTAEAAKALRMKQDDVYESLCNLATHIRNHIHIHYREGTIRIGAN